MFRTCIDLFTVVNSTFYLSGLNCSIFYNYRLGSLSKEHGTKTEAKKEEKEESHPDPSENDGQLLQPAHLLSL